MTEEQKAYRILQAAWVRENSIIVGDSVRIIGKFTSNSFGFYGERWDARRAKADTNGEVHIIDRIDAGCIVINSEYYPCFALEFIEHAPPATVTVELDRAAAETFVDSFRERYIATTAKDIAAPIKAALNK